MLVETLGRTRYGASSGNWQFILIENNVLRYPKNESSTEIVRLYGKIRLIDDRLFLEISERKHPVPKHYVSDSGFDLGYNVLTSLAAELANTTLAYPGCCIPDHTRRLSNGVYSEIHTLLSTQPH